MLDRDLIAYAIGIIKNSNTVTSLQLANDLKIEEYRALKLVEELEDCCLIVKFDGFYASTDYAELN